jgi:ankyrin repeat protein
LILAITMKLEDVARRLIEKGADVHVQTDGNRTSALMMASDADLVEIAKLLLAKGASPNVKDAHGKSALDYAKSDAMKKVLGGDE